ncbi:MAG TPA: hypothetical protein PLZ57_07165 [Pseudobdellovibrionaceae bacterium]|nr:hypothetical protein [Pseudobdellovibrionaceae bacterium]
MKVIGAIFSLFCFTGCATTNTGKTLQTMAIAGAAGVLYGLSRPEHREQNAALYGGLAAASAGAAGLLIWNTDSESERFRKEAQTLSEELDRIRAPRRILESPATFGAKIPAKYRSLVQPGSWRVSEIDQWVEDGENRLIHQGLVMELVPPSLNPSRSKGGSR